jgi:hypothetical protein
MMSRSPKYADVRLARERARKLAQERRRREEERRRRAEERRRWAEERSRQRQAEHAEELARLRTTLTNELAELRRQAAALPGGSSMRDIAGERLAIIRTAEELRRRLSTSSSRASVDSVRLAANAAERRLVAAADVLAGRLAAEQRAAALTQLESRLAEEPDRIGLDGVGAREVSRRLDAVRQARDDDRRFRSAYQALADSVQHHLDKVTEVRQRRERIDDESHEALEALDAVLAEAAEAGNADLPGMAEAREARARLIADLDAGRLDAAERGIAAVGQAAKDLEQALEEQLDHLERTRLLVEAAAIALPRAGFQIMRDSFVLDGTTAEFRAVRGDGEEPVSISVESTGEGTRLVYRGRAADFMVEHTAEGTVNSCPDTEELLERFHLELAVEDIETGELLWEGKPTRPDLRAARPYTGHADDSRQRE